MEKPSFAFAATLVVIALPAVAHADEPTTVVFEVPVVIDAEHVFELYGPSLGLGPDDAMRLVDVVRLSPDRDAYRFQQFHHDARVDGARVAVHARAGRASSVVGRIQVGLDLEPMPTRPESEARRVAERATGARTFGAPLPAEQLIVIPRNGREREPRLAWRFVIVTTAPLGEQVVDVDAYDLAVLDIWDTRKHRLTATALANLVPTLLPNPPGNWVAAPGHGLSLYNGDVELEVETNTSGGGHQYRLRRDSLPRVYTWDLGTSAASANVAPAEVIIDAAVCTSGPFEDCSVGPALASSFRPRVPATP